jgi:short-subunit dehydrogenase
MTESVTAWQGQRVLVTGASSGIGAAIARDLAGQGATVGLVARREELLELVLADCRAHAPDSVALPFDLTDLDGLGSLVQRAEAELGGIDVLVNNAGVTYAGPAATAPLDDLEAQLRINYLSPVRLTQLVVSAMTARGSGQVTVISSMAARTSTPGEAAYASAKSALSTYVEALAGELWGGPVRFHLVYPALIDLTEGVDGDDELARSSDGATPIPAPVAARAIRHQLESDEFELYIPETMRGFVAGRSRDVAGGIEFMAKLFREGRLH